MRRAARPVRLGAMETTLYDQIGGAASITRLIDVFYSRVLADPELKPFFAGVQMAKLRRMQEELFSAALGGPQRYSGRTMVEAHRTRNIGLKDYQARVALRIDEAVKLQTDSIVSIKTKGLIGEKFVQISPGGSDKIVPAGGRLTEVEAPVDLEELISKYVFGKV